MLTEVAKRLVFRGKDDCVIEPFPLPAAIEPHTVRVRNHVSVISAGTELAVLRGRHRAFALPRSEGTAWVQYPSYPGYSAVGDVIAVGEGVNDIGLGDRVYHPGPHATVGDSAASLCKVVPADVKDEDAAFFNLIRTAMTAVHRAPATLGSRVVVSGQGVVGILCAQLYALCGATVAGADMSRGRLALSRKLGLEYQFDLQEQSLEDWVRDVFPGSVDIIVEAAGVSANISACLSAASGNTAVVLLGSPREPMEIDPYTDIHRKGTMLIGAHVSTVDREVREKEAPLYFELARSRLRLDILRTHIVTLDEVPETYEILENNLEDHLSTLIKYL